MEVIEFKSRCNEMEQQLIEKCKKSKLSKDFTGYILDEFSYRMSKTFEFADSPDCSSRDLNYATKNLTDVFLDLSSKLNVH